MSLGRRKIRLEDPDSWVFNRMADVYDARPAYPDSLIDTLAVELSLSGPRIGDLGAGIGHLSVPLAARGFEVFAIEPALAMLERIPSDPRIHRLHGTAESVPELAESSLDAVVIADALHFLDAERTGREVHRILRPGGRLAVVVVELGDTPFMRSLRTLMESAAPRRPRAVQKMLAQLAGVANVRLEEERQFRDEREVEPEMLERILRSISFIGPAMNTERFEAFRSKVRDLGSPSWARSIRFWCGVNSQSARRA